MSAPRLKELYDATVKQSLKERFAYENAFSVPRLDKIVINMGVGEAVADTKKVQSAVGELTRISGQKQVVTRAKQAISTFKLRGGMPIGCKVTLRRDRMYEFLDRRSEEHTSELQSLMRISYAVFCLKKKKKKNSR